MRWLSPPKIADLLTVGHDKVLHWNKVGELRAVDVSTRRGQRPRWRISPEDLEDFLARRRATPPPKPTRRRHQHAQGVTEYY